MRSSSCRPLCMLKVVTHALQPCLTHLDLFAPHNIINKVFPWFTCDTSINKMNRYSFCTLLSHTHPCHHQCSSAYHNFITHNQQARLCMSGQARHGHLVICTQYFYSVWDARLYLTLSWLHPPLDISTLSFAQMWLWSVITGNFCGNIFSPHKFDDRCAS